MEINRFDVVHVPTEEVIGRTVTWIDHDEITTYYVTESVDGHHRTTVKSFFELRKEIVSWGFKGIPRFDELDFDSAEKEDDE